MAKRKRTNNDLQNITQKIKDQAIRTPLKTWCDLRCSETVCSSCSTCDTRRVTLFINRWFEKFEFFALYFCGCIVLFVPGLRHCPIIFYDTPHISLRSNSNKLTIRMWHSQKKHLLYKVVLLSLALKRYYWNNPIANIMRRFRNQKRRRTQLNDFCRSNYYYLKGSVFCLSFKCFCVLFRCVVFCFVCRRHVSFMTNVTSVSGLSIRDCPFGFL